MSRHLHAFRFVPVLLLAAALLLRVPSVSAAPPAEPEALQQFLEDAEAPESSAVVIVKNGKLVDEWSFGHTPGCIEAMSLARSAVGLADDLFRFMGITDFGWTLDDSGNLHVMAGVQLPPRALAKLGQRMLDGGLWLGRLLLPAEWVEQAGAREQGAATPR